VRAARRERKHSEEAEGKRRGGRVEIAQRKSENDGERELEQRKESVYVVSTGLLVGDSTSGNQTCIHIRVLTTVSSQSCFMNISQRPPRDIVSVRLTRSEVHIRSQPCNQVQVHS